MCLPYLKLFVTYFVSLKDKQEISNFTIDAFLEYYQCPKKTFVFSATFYTALAHEAESHISNCTPKNLQKFDQKDFNTIDFFCKRCV
jgi:hypothetical protein